MNIIPVVLSGGSGTRLWPLSRQAKPKQFIDLGLGSTLFRQTLERCRNDLFNDRPIVVANLDHRYLVAEELLLADIRADVLLEPHGRNTCAAIAAACLQASLRLREAIVLVLPSDHLIGDIDGFSRSIEYALPAAMDGMLVTFGVQPTRPDPGYGYIGFRKCPQTVHPVERFIEKPDCEQAKTLISSGSLWNSGNFLMRADMALAEIGRYEPELLRQAQKAMGAAALLKPVAGMSLSGLPEPGETRMHVLEAENLGAIRPVSFDHAVLERTELAGVLPVSHDWADLGNWESVSDVYRTDAANNRIEGQVCAERSSNNVVRSNERLTALLGVENLIVIDTPDALLVADRKCAVEVNRIVDGLKSAGIPQADREPAIRKAGTRQQICPWGHFTSIDEGGGYQVKRLTVSPGATLSLQSHKHRAEHWVVISGIAETLVDGKSRRLEPTQSIDIPRGSVHRLANCGDTPLLIIEVQTGEYLGEDDIVRLEDVYNRV